MIFSQKYRGVRVAIFPVYSCMGLDSARDRIDRREGSNLIYILLYISFSKSMVCVYILSLLYVFLCLRSMYLCNSLLIQFLSCFLCRLV
jgi:hypothetical protein